jgi:hypothetical protein
MRFAAPIALFGTAALITVIAPRLDSAPAPTWAASRALIGIAPRWRQRPA